MKTTNIKQFNSFVIPNATFTCDAVIRFENRLKNTPFDIDPVTLQRYRRIPKGSIQDLMMSTQEYYDRYRVAESRAQRELLRSSAAEAQYQALHERACAAESNCKTNLYGGLAVGVAIGAGIVGTILFISKRIKNKRQKKNQ